MARRQRKTTRQQYELLIDFVEENRILNHGKIKPSEARKVNTLWELFASKANKLTYGPPKNAAQWKKVFGEWKVNTKRKSRSLLNHSQGTGGGPGSTKSLSDLEERLLGVISRIHLGDHNLPETVDDELVKDELDCEEMVQIIYEDKKDIIPIYTAEETQCNQITEHTYTKNVVEDNQEDLIHTAEETECNHITEHTYTKNVEDNNRKDQNSKRSSFNKPPKSTNSLLKAACESFKQSNKASEAVSGKQADATMALASAINNFAEVYKMQAEASLLMAKAKRAEVKILHFKTFGNLDTFQ